MFTGGPGGKASSSAMSAAVEQLDTMLGGDKWGSSGTGKSFEAPSSIGSSASKLDDLVMGVHEWRNIQDVVRSTFSAMHKVVREQGERMRFLERSLKEKANWSEVEASLQARATIQDVNQSLAGIAGVLNEKASSSYVIKACDERATRIELSESNASSSRRIEALEKECAELRAQMASLQQELNAKQDRDEAESSFATKSDAISSKDMMERFDRLSSACPSHDDLEAVVRTMATREEVQAALQTRAGVVEVERNLSAKADTDRMMTALGERPTRVEVNDLVASRLLEARTQLSAATAQQVSQLVAARRVDDNNAGDRFHGPTVNGALASAASVRDLISLLDQKANISDVEVLLASKVDRAELNDAISTRASDRDVEARVSRASEAIATEVQTALLQSQREIVAVLNKKAYKADVHRSLKTKADAQGTAEAIARKPDAQEVREALSQKVDKTSCQRALATKVSHRHVYSFLFFLHHPA